MEELNRLMSILKLLSEVNKSVGKTFIQKSIFLLQEGLAQNFNYNFRLYTYGPYSQELTNDVDILNEFGFINMKINPIVSDYEDEPYGYRYNINLTEKGKSALGEVYTDLELDETVVKKVITLLGTRNTRSMELKATILYFSKEIKDEAEIIRSVLRVKPYFSESDINKTIEFLKTNSLI